MTHSSSGPVRERLERVLQSGVTHFQVPQATIGRQQLAGDGFGIADDESQQTFPVDRGFPNLRP